MQHVVRFCFDLYNIQQGFHDSLLIAEVRYEMVARQKLRVPSRQTTHLCGFQSTLAPFSTVLAEYCQPKRGHFRWQLTPYRQSTEHGYEANCGDHYPRTE